MNIAHWRGLVRALGSYLLSICQNSLAPLLPEQTDFIFLITFLDFELRAITCKDKNGDETGSAVAHDIYKAQWAKIQKNINCNSKKKTLHTSKAKIILQSF